MHHIYLRCDDLGVLFYTTEDRLVYYTLAAVKAKKHRVRVSAASLMFTHIHQSVQVGSREQLSCYLHDTNTSFCRLYNNRYKREGILLERHPGHSQKLSSKDKRSNLIYVYNNHVEKGLCSRALEERWSLLAYAASDHPFSAPIDRKKCSKALRKALNLVDRRVASLKALEYKDIDLAFKSLQPDEREQYIDYVISKYALIDYNYAISHFGSLRDMITACDSTTGGEYQIKEDYTKLKDTGYADLIQHAERQGYLKEIYAMPASKKMEEIVFCMRAMAAHPDHLKRFFHREFVISKG